MKRPHVLLLLTDQERAPTFYEDAALTRFRRQRLTARAQLAQEGLTLAQHYTASNACSPSRAALFTGQHASLHGVSQTGGLAKQPGDPRVQWLVPGELPTLGHYFQEAGYDTHYFGKWHLSDADLRDREGSVVETLDEQGRPQRAGLDAYHDRQPLSGFGFGGWVGPEPHGPRLRDRGSLRDPFVARQAVDFLQRRAQGGERPFLLVVSLVNPHDIVAWPGDARFTEPDDGVPAGPAPPTADEQLRHKPAIQRRFRDAYPQGYGPRWLVEPSYRKAAALRRRYHRLLLESDQQLGRILQALDSGPLKEDTVVLWTSDHGELLGAHGGLQQKWHCAYEEAIRVPCVVRLPDGSRAGQQEQRLTSHTDVLPTLLSLAGLDQAALGARLERSCTEVHPPVGRDLAPLIRSAATPPGEDAVYFQTSDHPLSGQSQQGALHSALPPFLQGVFDLRYDAPEDVPGAIEALVIRFAPGPGQPPRRFKIARTYDDPERWTTPHREHRVARIAGDELVRAQPLTDEWELYCLDDDPDERVNLAHNPRRRPILEALQQALSQARQAHLRTRHHPRLEGGELSRRLPARRPYPLEGLPRWLQRLVLYLFASKRPIPTDTKA